jgi:hypothetical protein
MVKLKPGKFDTVYYDGDKQILSNGKWAVRLIRPTVEVTDKELAGAMLAGKSFARISGFIEFEYQIPDMDKIMSPGLDPIFRGKAIVEAGIMRYRIGAVGKERLEGGCVFKGDGFESTFLPEYADILLGFNGAPVYQEAAKSPAYVVDKQGDDETVLALVMPKVMKD